MTFFFTFSRFKHEKPLYTAYRTFENIKGNALLYWCTNLYILWADFFRISLRWRFLSTSSSSSSHTHTRNHFRGKKYRVFVGFRGFRIHFSFLHLFFICMQYSLCNLFGCTLILLLWWLWFRRAKMRKYFTFGKMFKSAWNTCT